MNLKPFYIAGEVFRIRQVTGDYSVQPHNHEAIKAFEWMAEKTATPVQGAILIASSVMTHLKRNQRLHGERIFSFFELAFLPTWGSEEAGNLIQGGWEWRQTEVIWSPNLEAFTGGVWYEHSFRRLKGHEWTSLCKVLETYEGNAEKNPIHVENGKRGAEKRWGKTG